MRSTKAVRRLAAMCALVLTGLLLTAAPASADQTTALRILGGDPSAQTEFEMYFVTQIYEHAPPQTYISSTYSYTQLELGKYGVISATDCQLETWLTLTEDIPGVNTWDSPHLTYHCMDFLSERGVFVQEGHTGHWDTRADWIVTHSVVRLYFNNSSTPGRTFDMTGNWTQTS